METMMRDTQSDRHRDEDEWFYCLEGRYIVEVGDQRFELNAGDSVLGPRRVEKEYGVVNVGPPLAY